MKYWAVFQLGTSHALKNYKALIGLSVFLVTCLIIFAHLWKIAAAKTGVNNLDPNQLLWFIAFNEWVLISLPSIQEEMEHDLQSGHLAYLLPRPISYLGSTFCQAMGTLCVNLVVLGFVAFLFTWMMIGSLPFSVIGLPVTVLLGLLSGMLGIIFQMLIGLSAFWLHDVEPCHWIWEKLLFILGGLILPLSVYPEWMQTLAKFTPFPLILGERSALALEFDFNRVLIVFVSILTWIGIGVICLLVTYRKGLRILNIEGG